MKKPKLSDAEVLQIKLRQVELMRLQVELKEGLPHLYGPKWYTWAREFFESTNRENFLCAANQISKSSTQIRKCIDWATDKSKWPTLWPSLRADQIPNQFWYFYPTGDVAQTEFESKWVPEFLPRGKYKDDPVYGWDEVFDKGVIKKIEFKSGVTIYFKTYAQKIKDLQSGTVYSIFCFPAGTKIKTLSGDKNIEELSIGDEVLSHKGIRKISATGSRIAETRQISFSGGAEITTTDEHPFFTKRGWVEAKDLIEGDVCFKTPACLSLILQIWCYLTEVFSKDIQKAQTGGLRIIGEMRRVFSSTWHFGSSTIIGVWLKGISFTTWTSTPSIMNYQICRNCPEQNTQGFTKRLNGRAQKLGHGFVFNVGKILKQDLLKRLLGKLVRLSVGGLTLGLRLSVKNVVFRSLYEEIVNKDFVLKNVQTKKEKVHSITVEDAHTYFANDFLVHNCDEELPVDFVPELQARLNASDGYFHMVFTATLGQLYWAQTMEPATKRDEKYPNAWKRQVSVYDCQRYEDGSPSHWTDAKINRAIAKCPTEAEKQRRIFGKFVKSEGLMFPSFDYDKNTADYQPPPRHWHHFSGIDPGTGGEKAHPAAIVLIAVSPDYKHGRVWRSWRGDGLNTASPDIYAKYKELRGKLPMTGQKYDWASREFFLHVSAKGEAFTAADKDHVSGYSLLNTLFKSGMLKIYLGDAENDKLISEIRTLSATGDKRKAHDDLCDALRYAANAVPWDFSDLEVDQEQKDQFAEIKGEKVKTSSDLRREWFMNTDKAADYTVEDELDFWNDAQDP